MLAPAPVVPVAMKVSRDEIDICVEQISMLMLNPTCVEVRRALPTAHAAVAQDLHPVTVRHVQICMARLPCL